MYHDVVYSELVFLNFITNFDSRDRKSAVLFLYVYSCFEVFLCLYARDNVVDVII